MKLKKYTFGFKDENGDEVINGWNWVMATSKAQARSKAKKEHTTEGRDYDWGRNKGLYPDMDTLKRVSEKSFSRTWEASYMD